MAVDCQPCKERGREQVAHRIVAKTPMCQWCFSGRPHPLELAAARQAPLATIEGLAWRQIQQQCREWWAAR